MKLILTRTEFLKTGIFGMIEPVDESLLLMTLEHAYPQISDGVMSSTYYAPKIPPGTYTCIRGLHRLEGMTEPFETFEITGVEGHTNLLFHSGNTNHDSSGCILLGLARQDDTAILHSRNAFKLFMDLQKDTNSFALTVS